LTLFSSFSSIGSSGRGETSPPTHACIAISGASTRCAYFAFVGPKKQSKRIGKNSLNKCWSIQSSAWETAAGIWLWITFGGRGDIWALLIGICSWTFGGPDVPGRGRHDFTKRLPFHSSISAALLRQRAVCVARIIPSALYSHSFFSAAPIAVRRQVASDFPKRDPFITYTSIRQLSYSNTLSVLLGFLSSAFLSIDCHRSNFILTSNKAAVPSVYGYDDSLSFLITNYILTVIGVFQIETH